MAAPNLRPNMQWCYGYDLRERQDPEYFRKADARNLPVFRVYRGPGITAVVDVDLVGVPNRPENIGDMMLNIMGQAVVNGWVSLRNSNAYAGRGGFHLNVRRLDSAKSLVVWLFQELKKIGLCKEEDYL